MRVIDFAYPALAATGPSAWTIGAVSPAPQAGYLWHHFIAGIIALNPDRLRMRALADVLREGSPFIYPLELRWEFLEWIQFGWVDIFLTPHVPPTVLDAARAGRAMILLSFSHEARPLTLQAPGGWSLSLFDVLQAFVQRHDLPPGALWFVHGDHGGDAGHRQWLAARGIARSAPLPFETRHVNLFSCLMQSLWRAHASGRDLDLQWETRNGAHEVRLHIATHVALRPSSRPMHAIYSSVPAPDGPETGPETGPKTGPDKLFLCMNKVTRPHRRLLVCFLQSQRLLDRSLVSFRDDAPEATRFPTDALQQAWEEVQARQPLKIDQETLHPSHLYGDTPVRISEISVLKVGEAWPYRRSFFSIVNETHFTSSVCFLSEKIWKPLINAQPFIVVGTPGSLAYLHRLGFKTFAPFIDESYDDITDDFERMNGVFRIIQQLGSLSHDQLLAMRAALQPIVRYNAALLQTMTTPFDILLHDMHARLAAARCAQVQSQDAAVPCAAA